MLQKIFSRFYSKNSKAQPLDKEPEPLLDEFTSCSDLPMLNFIKITCTGDLKWLGRCGDPEKTWQQIHSEYCELSGDAQSSRALELAKQIAFLSNKIYITNTIVNYMVVRGRVDELVLELQKMGYRLKYTDLEKDLQRTLSISKSDQIKLNMAKEQYAKLDTGKETTEFEWYQILSALAKHRQVAVINPSMITVVEYIAMDKDLREYIKATQKIGN